MVAGGFNTPGAGQAAAVIFLGWRVVEWRIVGAEFQNPVLVGRRVWRGGSNRPNRRAGHFGGFCGCVGGLVRGGRLALCSRCVSSICAVDPIGACATDYRLTLRGLSDFGASSAFHVLRVLGSLFSLGRFQCFGGFVCFGLFVSLL